MSGPIVRSGTAALVTIVIIATSTAGIAAHLPILRRAADPASARSGATDEWSRSVFAQIERDEYQVSSQGDVLEAPNRANKLRTRFRADRIEVVPRTATTDSPWSVLWRTTSWGREGRLISVRDVEVAPHADGTTVRYNRAGL